MLYIFNEWLTKKKEQNFSLCISFSDAKSRYFGIYFIFIVVNNVNKLLVKQETIFNVFNAYSLRIYK